MQNPSPTKWALLIGITDYPKLPATKKLFGCINDVNLMRELLFRRFGFTVDNIKSLCNELATRTAILEAFEDLVASVGINDVVVVFFAGHGSYLKVEDAAKKGSGWAGTIVPYDSGRKSTGHPSTDITDVKLKECLLEPLVRKTRFVTLFFDSCHSASILRDEFGTAVRGIDPDGEIRKVHDMNNAEIGGWLPTPKRGSDSFGGYVLLASCRADETACEMPIEDKIYGAFTYLLCTLILKSGRNADIRSLFRLASANLTAKYPHQHPILEGSPDAIVFGTYHLETPRYLLIKKIEIRDRTTLVEMDGGLASGVTPHSIWAIRPLGNFPQKSDVRIKVKEVSAFVSRAEVIHPGGIESDHTYGCFEVSHVYGDAALNVSVDFTGDPQLQGFLSQTDVSGTLNIVDNAENADMKVVLLKPRDVIADGDIVPQLGPLNCAAWITIARNGRIIIPPTTRLTDLIEKLRKLARYQFGLSLRNMNENNELRGKVSLRLRKRPKGSGLHDPWQDVSMGMDGFPHFQNGDHIACIVSNDSDVTVWPYVLEFAEDGSVHQRYPLLGGEEQLASRRSTKEVAKMALHVSSENAFQLAPDMLLKAQHGRSPQKLVTEVMKLFASTERIDLSLLLQTSRQARGVRGLSDLLYLDDPSNICGWWTVEEPFVLESD